MANMRIPPQNIEAEQSILGSLMLDKESWDHVGDLLTDKDFYFPAHQKIYSTIQELIFKNLPVDLITVTNLLQSNGHLDSVGGATVIIDLINKTVSAANIGAYAKIVREKSILRKMIVSSSEIVDKAYSSDFPDIDTFIDQAEEKFYKLGSTNVQEGLVGPIDIVKESMLKIEELYKRGSDITGISSGFTYLDKMMSGLHGGELIIVAARPSMGKTAFSLNIAQHVALRQNKTVAYFSLEMSRESVMIRILAAEARINIKDVRSGKVGDNAWPKLIEAAGVISDSRLFIDGTSILSPFEVRSRCRRLKSHHGLDLIIIDYLQLMDLKQKVESRERAVSEISKTLKALAKELDVPVVALAQLNRGVEGRMEKRPMLSDLRESGSIEQDADVILMLFREDYYDKEDPEKQGQAEVIVGKQRNGPTGTVKLRWEAEYGRFRDQEYDPSHFHGASPSKENDNKGKNRDRAPQYDKAPPSANGYKPKKEPKNMAPGAEI